MKKPIHLPTNGGGLVRPDGRPATAQRVSLQISSAGGNVVLDMGAETRLLGIDPDNAELIASHIMLAAGRCRATELPPDAEGQVRPTNLFICGADDAEEPHSFFSVNRDPGIEPISIVCPNCGARADSWGTAVDTPGLELLPEIRPISIVFVRPSEAEIAKYSVSMPGIRRWVQLGGLVPTARAGDQITFLWF